MASVDENPNVGPELESIPPETVQDDGTESASRPSLIDRLKARIPAPLKTVFSGSWIPTPIQILLKKLFSSPKNIAITVAGVLILFAGIWWLLQPEPKSFSEELQEALKLLEDPHDVEGRQAAMEIAKRLQESGNRDPNFAGGPEFVLGIASFRDAQDEDASTNESTYLRAIRYLRLSERSIEAKYRPEFVFALGSSLHSVGARKEAIPYLKQAIQLYPSGRNEASLRLTDIYLDRKNPDELREGLELTKQVLKSRDLTRTMRDKIYLQQAHVHLALNEHELARQAIAKVSDVVAENHGTRIFRAQTLMANAETLLRGYGISVISAAANLVLQANSELQFRQLAKERLQEALTELEPIANVIRLDQTFPRQALFLMGVCSHRLAELDVDNTSATKFDQAINYFGRAAKNYIDSHEGVAASLRLADILRQTGRDEEALLAYKNALGTVKSAARYRNRWIPLEEFRSRVLDAWNQWADQGQFQMAIKLALLMPPLIPEVQAQELHAIANSRWATQLSRELKSVPYSLYLSKRKQVLKQWRTSGASHAKLARLVSTTTKYPDVLWMSAMHYRNGHSFKNALDQITRFINLRPKNRLPLALVRRGQLLMHLDRFEEAREHFNRVLDTFPTDAAVFEARYEIGRANLELGKVEAAEKVWRGILTSGQLRPEAIEWQKSLFSLGKLLYQTGVMKREEIKKKHKGEITKSFIQDIEKTMPRWNETRLRLMEYTERYPDAPDAIEARYLLAKSLQESAQFPMYRLKEAEVENVKRELHRKRYSLLNQAREQFRKLQSQLLPLEEAEQLDALGQRFLRGCYFELAHCYYGMEEYRKAIVAYNSAANRYPQDPQVLMAYLQMANCNDRLGDPSEAVSMLVQAKVILKQLPESAFKSDRTNLSKKEWEAWLDWARKLRSSSTNSGTQPTPP
ncbi:MAG: hypothetical protein Tsb009_02480 [Planctomycetaceae bacterium]